MEIRDWRARQVNAFGLGKRDDACDVKMKLNTTHEVGVGMVIADHPLHGSGRAELPHPALVSGHNRKSSTQSTPQRFVPELTNVEGEGPHALAVERHSIVLIVSAQHRAYPHALFPWVGMHASSKFLF